MLRKLVIALIVAAVGALLFTQRKDLQRYLGIQRLSHGDGHPELVPVDGRTGYVQDAAKGAPDGTGDFDAGKHGGPDREPVTT